MVQKKRTNKQKTNETKKDNKRRIWMGGEARRNWEEQREEKP